MFANLRALALRRAATRAARAPARASLAMDNAGLRRAVIVVLGLATVTVMTVAVGLWHLREDALTAQSRTLSALSNATADELTRGLQGLTLAMQSTRDDVQSGRLRPLAPDAGLELQRRLSLLWWVRKLWLVDVHGHVLAVSAGATVPPCRVSARVRRRPVKTAWR